MAGYYDGPLIAEGRFYVEPYTGTRSLMPRSGLSVEVTEVGIRAEEEEEDAQPEEPPEPEWPDIMHGPLIAEGRFNVEPYTGDPRFPMPLACRKPEKEILPQGLGILQYINISVVTSHWSKSGCCIPWWASKLSAMPRRL